MGIHLALVCVAGGRGARFGGDKLAERVAGRSILEHSLAALRRAYATAPLVAVVPSHRIESWRELMAAGFPDAELWSPAATGGRTRCGPGWPGQWRAGPMWSPCTMRPGQRLIPRT